MPMPIIYKNTVNLIKNYDEKTNMQKIPPQRQPNRNFTLSNPSYPSQKTRLLLTKPHLRYFQSPIQNST